MKSQEDNDLSNGIEPLHTLWKIFEEPKLKIPVTNNNSLIHEYCRFKDAPCNYTGKGWYDRCAWCKDNNGFKSRNDDTMKPF